MGIIYCYNDLNQWGSEVAAEIQNRKGSSQMMTHAVQVEDEKGTAAFIHVSDQERKYTQELAAEIGKKENVLMVPTAREIILHDDILCQHLEFANWMPMTLIALSMKVAEEYINNMPYPAISMTVNPSMRHWRRVLNNPTEAYEEANKLFSDDGLILNGSRIQQGYSIWQPAMEITGVKWHVFILGGKYAVITEMVSNVNPNDPNSQFKMIDVLDPRHVGLLDFVRGFAEDCKLDWACCEVIGCRGDEEGVVVPYITNYMVSWPSRWFERGGLVFEMQRDHKWESTGIPAVKIWGIVAEWIMGKLLE